MHANHLLWNSVLDQNVSSLQLTAERAPALCGKWKWRLSRVPCDSLLVCLFCPVLLNNLGTVIFLPWIYSQRGFVTRNLGNVCFLPQRSAFKKKSLKNILSLFEEILHLYLKVALHAP